MAGLEDLPPPRKSLGHFVKTNAESITRIARWAPVASTDTVLDIGCGDGGVLLGLVETTNCRAIGVEIDEGLCNQGRDAARAAGYDERRLKFYNSPIEEVSFGAFDTVTLVYIYALFVAQNRYVVALLQQMIARGVRIVTSTFELPTVDLGSFSKVWPDPDTPEGLLELACPTCTTKLHLYRGDTKGLQEIRQVALEMVRFDPNKLKDISKRLQGDKEIVLAAVTKNGLQLQFASDDLRDDREVVGAAAEHSPKAIKYASSRLKGDLRLARQIVKRHGSLIRYFDDHVVKDLEIGLSAFEGSKRAVFFLSRRAPRRMRQRESMEFPATPYCPRMRDLRSRAAGMRLPWDSKPEVSAGLGHSPDPSVAGGRPLPAEPEEELGQAPATEEEPEREPEEEDNAELQPFLPGEETWTCGGCGEDTGPSYSEEDCFWCGERRGTGLRVDNYCGLDPVKDRQYTNVRGVLVEGAVRTADGWRLPLAQGGVEVLRRIAQGEGTEGTKGTEGTEGTEGAREGETPEALEAWAVVPPWQFWHRHKDDTLNLWNAAKQEFESCFPRVGS